MGRMRCLTIRSSRSRFAARLNSGVSNAQRRPVHQFGHPVAPTFATTPDQSVTTGYAVASAVPIVCEFRHIAAIQ